MNKTALSLLAGFLGVIIFAFVGAYWLTFHKPFRAPAPLPTLGTVAPFEFTERSGQPFSNKKLHGKIWVADFIFTACPGPCFKLSTNLAQFQKEIASQPDVDFVSFSVNPTGDTPSVLAKYADKFGADPHRWFFLTGDKAKLYNLIETSFKLAVQENYDPKAPPEEKFIHSTRLVLIDRNGAIRGYYDGLAPETFPKLKQDIARLAKEPNPHALPSTTACPQCLP